MFNVCTRCGAYHADKRVAPLPENPGWADTVCPTCGHQSRFRHLPLLIISGASGTGKTTICRRLAGQISEAVLLELDILWRPEFDRPDDAYGSYLDTWLRMVKNIAQSGRPVVVFGAGIGVPSNLEQQVERRYIAGIRTLALTCDDATLTARLQARPGWRESGSDTFIEAQSEFNRWSAEVGPTLSPPIETYDTTKQSLDANANHVAAWIRRTIGACSESPSTR